MHRKSRRAAFLAVALAIPVMALGACGGAADEPSAEAPAQTTTAARTTAPAPEPEPAADDGDTGRMSQGEWESARDVSLDVNREMSDYLGQVSSRCALIAGAGEVAAALECVDEAYGGVEDKMSFAAYTLDDLTGHVGARCLRSVEIAAGIVNRPLYQAAKASRSAYTSFDVARAEAAGDELLAQSKRWATSSGNMLQLCAPE